MDKQIIIVIITGLFGIFGGGTAVALVNKWRHPEDRMKNVSDAIAPLLKSIEQLTEQNKTLIESITTGNMIRLEQAKEIATLKEKINEQSTKIESLQKQVKHLTDELQKTQKNK